MLVVETIAKIRRAYFGQRKPIKAICRELGVSRKVVRKVIRSGATEFRYEREVQPRPRIGPWRDRLDAMLAANEAKPGRERLTLIRLFEELRALGYAGGYDAVRRYARARHRRLDQVVPAHLQEAAVVGPVLADEDRLDCRLHVVVEAAPAGALEEGKGPVVGVEDHLLGLARVGPHEEHPAVAEPDMGDLHGHRHPFRTTISWLRSNWWASPGAKVRGT